MTTQGWLDLAAFAGVVVVIICWAIDGYQTRKSYLRQMDEAELKRDQYLRERRAELDALQKITSRRETKRPS